MEIFRILNTLLFCVFFLCCCTKENTGPELYCIKGTVFKEPGTVLEVNTDSGSDNTVDYITIVSPNIYNPIDTNIYRNILGNMYRSMNPGDKIINCQ